MTIQIDKLEEIASDYDAVVFDQWGVLHDGTSAYGGAVDAIECLAQTATNVGVLSNSGKRAKPNEARIASMGFDRSHFDQVMTSGEALWRDIAEGAIPHRSFIPVERAAGDAEAWAQGLPIAFSNRADAILLMGLPDGSDLTTWEAKLDAWAELGLPLYCSNPDRQSPRAGSLVISPGALAFAYQDRGGETLFYGKPHEPVFHALETVFGKGRYLMVGDSLEHDIAGAQRVGWDSLLIEGGLYRAQFAEASNASEADALLSKLVSAQSCQPPTYRMKELM